MHRKTISGTIIRALDATTSTFEGISGFLEKTSRDLDAWNARLDEKRNAEDYILRVIEEVRQANQQRKAEIVALSTRRYEPGAEEKAIAIVKAFTEDNRRLDEAAARYERATGASLTVPTVDNALWDELKREVLEEIAQRKRARGSDGGTAK